MAEIVGTQYFMREVIRLINMEIKAMHSGATNLVPVITGDPGIGKSETIKWLANKMNYGVLILSGGAIPQEGWSGLPEFGTMNIDAKLTVDGQNEAKTTEWTQSDIIRNININTEKAIKEGKLGLLVLLDDLHLVEPFIQKYLFEFLQNKTLQNYKIDPRAHLIGAMNGKDSAGLEGFLSAVLNRLAIYNVKFDMDFWYENIGYSLHPYIASFAQQTSNYKFFNGANATDGASPSPRSWTDLSNFIPIIEEELGNDLGELNRNLQIATEARVGREAQVEFMKHVKIFQKFDFQSIFDKKEKKYRIGEDINDQILMAFIIRYMKTEEDAEYLIEEILNHNTDRRTFISIFVQEFGTLYQNIHKMPSSEGKKAFNTLSKLITDPKKVDNDLIDIVVEGMIDIG
jgi:hypothetical protein